MASMFFKMAAIPTHFHHISDYSGHTVVILVSIPRFWGSRNPVGAIIYAYKCTKAHMAAILLLLEGNTQVLEVGESIGITI